jgi:hypothetical protein
MQWFLDFNYDYFMETICICRWQMNMLMTSQNQPRISSITNVAPDGSSNQNTVFTSNSIIIIYYGFSLLHIFSLVLQPWMSAYITNLVCYTYFHWFLNPECQHIFGKQTGYIFQSPKTIKTWTTGACVVKNMLAMYLKYHKAGLTPTTPERPKGGNMSHVTYFHFAAT